MSKCVLDTTICVDLWNGGIFELLLRLPHEFVLPDVIAEECKEPPGAKLIELGVRRVSLEPDQVPLAEEFSGKYQSVSTGDVFALTYSKANHFILITGDKDLRIAAGKESVEIHGVLWILDQMVDAGILPKSEAVTALEKMIDCGGWLPGDEYEKRFKKWSRPD